MVGSSATTAASPDGHRARGDDADGLLRQLGGALGGHPHVGRVRQHDDLLGGHLVDAGQELVGRRVERRAAVQHARAEAFEELAHAVAGDDREHAAGGDRLAHAQRALLDLLVHVGHIEARDRAGAVEQVGRALGLVRVDVDLQRVRVADDQHRVAEALEPRDPRRRIEPGAGDREVRAVAIRRGRVLRVRDARGSVVLERRRVGPAQRRDHAGEDHGQRRSRRRPRRPRRAGSAAAPGRA